MPKITIHVPRRYDGRRLDQAVLAILSDPKSPYPEALSRNAFQRQIEAGKVLVNGKIQAAPKSRVFFGDQIDIGLAEAVPKPKPRAAVAPLEIIRKTKHFIAVAKPAGLTTHSPHPGSSAPTLLEAFLDRYPELRSIGDPERPALLHRLDRETSGLLLFARTADAYGALKEAFGSRSIEKCYLALVWGEVRNERIIQAPLRRSKGTIRQRLGGAEEAARTAETLITPLASFPETGASLVLARPKTGRTHQIRVHLASIGHPVLGDRLYGSKLSKKSPIPAPRQLLHAWRLRFSLTGEVFELEAPLPEDFVRALEAAEPSRFSAPEGLSDLLAEARTVALSSSDDEAPLPS